MKLRAGKWSAVQTLVEGGTDSRFLPVALAVDDDRTYVAWHRQLNEEEHGYHPPWIEGCVWTGDDCSPSRRLDSGTSPLGTEALGLVRDPSGGVRVLWTDDREHHWRFDWYQPSWDYMKIYERSFSAREGELGEPVLSKGRYNVAMVTPVRDPLERSVEVVYFRLKAAADFRDTIRGQGIYRVRRNGAGWSKPEPVLTRERGPGGREEVSSISAARGRQGDELVAYGGEADGSDSIFARKLQVVHEDQEGRLEFNTLAEGIEDGGYIKSAIKVAPAGDGTFLIAYQKVPEGGSDLEASAPLYLLDTDGVTCLGEALVAPTSVHAIFDLAVDGSGEAHVVWVDDDGEQANLRHRSFELGSKSSSGGS